jgi:HD superfamily phosphodiesterase
MNQLDALWNRARADLAITTEHGEPDVFLWEHSARVAQNAQRIAKFPCAVRHTPDEPAVLAAALYHDASWVAQVREGEIARHEVLACPAGRNHRELSALILERSLSKLLPRDSLDRAVLAVQTLHDRKTDLVEGQIVADAENLDEFGVLSLWLTVRRGTLEGKGVQAVLDTWQKKAEYRFWSARLEDCFHFDPVRAIAQKRLERLKLLMSELATQQNGVDIAFSPSPPVRAREKKEAKA